MFVLVRASTGVLSSRKREAGELFPGEWPFGLGGPRAPVLSLAPLPASTPMKGNAMGQMSDRFKAVMNAPLQIEGLSKTTSNLMIGITFVAMTALLLAVIALVRRAH